MGVTRNVGIVRPYRNVRIEHFPEGASQTFVVGDLLTYSATADTGNRVIKATSGTTLTNLVGFAAEAATGTAATKIAVWVATPLAEFVGNICTAAVAAVALDNDMLGANVGIVADTTNACWRVDVDDDQTNANAVAIITKLLDDAGDTAARVAFRIHAARDYWTTGASVTAIAKIRGPF